MAATSKPIRKKIKAGAQRESLVTGHKRIESPTGSQKKMKKIAGHMKKHSESPKKGHEETMKKLEKKMPKTHQKIHKFMKAK